MGVHVQVAADGSFTYAPTTALSGLSIGESIVDRFSYTVTGAGTGTAQVLVTVTGANDPPTAIDDLATPDHPDLYVRANTTTEIDFATVTGNDLDPDVNDRLTVTDVSPTSQLGATVTLVGGRIVYDPCAVNSLNTLAAGQRLSDYFTYTTADSQGATSSAEIEVVVQSPLNVLPETLNDSITISEDGALQGGGNLLANDLDTDVLPGDAPLAVAAQTVTSLRVRHGDNRR